MVRSPDSPHFSPSTRIILMTPPPVYTPLPCDRLFETTRAYADGVRSLALDEKVALADVWTALWEGVGKQEAALEKVLRDGLHLNKKGYEASP